MIWATVAKPLAENGLSPLGLVLALLAVGLPLGYLLYQWYWFWYWNRWGIVRLPVRREGRISWACIVPRDRGYEILRDAHIDFKSLVGVALDTTAAARDVWPWPGFPVIGFGILLERPRDIIERYKRNWHLANLAWYHTLGARGLEFLDKEAQFSGDVYHSLGCTRTAAAWAFTIFGLLLWVENGLGLDPVKWGQCCAQYWVRVLCNLILLVGTYLLVSHAREDALVAHLSLKHHVITALARLRRVH